MSDATLATPSAESWRRYSTGAIILHWLIGLLIFALLGSGVWMTDALDVAETQGLAIEVYQIHKSLGIAVLALTVVRILWRILHPAPPLPDGMSRGARGIAHASHVAFYFLMLAMPLTGWAMASASPIAAPTFVFWTLQIPYLPILPDLAPEAKHAAETALRDAHGAFGWTAIALIALHVGAALKHHFIDRDAVLARMAPGVSPRGEVSETIELAEHLPAWRYLASALVLGGAVGGAIWLVDYDAERRAAGTVEDAGPSLDVVAAATVWGPVLEESAITFSGLNSGAPFTGRFESWKARIAFDPEALSVSEVIVVIDTPSATVGDAFTDAAMAEPGWFDAAGHPKATFTAATFEKKSDQSFIAHGAVAIRGVETPVTLPFELKIDGDRADMKAIITLDRLAFGIGAEPDPNAVTVSRDIEVGIELAAVKVR